jgi:hypothetical protein
MITRIISIRTQYNDHHKAEIVLSTDLAEVDISEAKAIITKGKALVVEIKEHRKKRSLDSNAYAWHLINEIANVLRSSKDEVYLQMLKRYGQSAVISVIDKAADTFRKSVKYCEDMGEADMGDKHFIHIRVFMGSSEFDTRMMSIFIDGIVSEAKELGIETMTFDELAKMKSQWG